MSDENTLSDPEAEIIVKKIMLPGAAAHGSAWKVAYADFVTAMMAFFLLLWLLNATTDEQQAGISNFFEPVGVRQGSSGSDGLFGGISATEPGPVRQPTTAAQPTVQIEATIGDKDAREERVIEDADKPLPNLTRFPSDYEEKQFMAAEAAVQRAVEEIPELRDLHESVEIETTDEGLVIKMIDQSGQSMFEPGTARLNEQARNLLIMIASVVERLPNRIAISGHTDAEPLTGAGERTNWELSLERANAARQLLEASGVPAQRFEKVVGRAARELRLPDDPFNPQNRRVIITLLREGYDGRQRIPEPPRITGGQ